MTRKSSPTDAIQARVAEHYARPDLEKKILDALIASGKDVDRIDPDDLSPVDELHIGGRQATVALAEQIGVTPEMHLLDVGSGLGGPSRFLAGKFGCRVTGIDLTEEFVATATALARRVGLADRVSYRQASALALPFEAGSFDGATMIHVGMNIQNKVAAFAEIRRVLRAGAVFAIYDVMRVGPGELGFPVHWAATGETSFLARPEDYRRVLEGAGFTIEKQRDRGDFARELFAQAMERARQGIALPPLSTQIFAGRDTPQKLANVAGALEARIIAPVELICRAR